MFVFNDCRTDARVLREARSLIAAGHVVTIFARPTDPWDLAGDRESHDGLTIVRVPIWTPLRLATRGGLARLPAIAGRWLHSGAWRRPGSLGRAVLLVVATPFLAVAAAVLGVLRVVLRRLGVSAVDYLVRWRSGVEPWAAAAAAAARAANGAPTALDVFHGHDLPGLLAATAARDGGPGWLVYDSHEIYLEAGSSAKQPGWARSPIARRERALVAGADAVVTVNASLARVLGERFGRPDVVSVMNCPPRWAIPEPLEDRLRTAAGIEPGRPVVLYHGAFSSHRGIEELAGALGEPGLEVVHAVYLGYGNRTDLVDAAVAAAGTRGRIHVLPRVSPDELPMWIASATAGIVAIQPSTLNHRLSSPNKLFECLAAGVPVVGSDFPEIRRILLEDPDGPLGAVCDPADLPALARAIRSIVTLDESDRADLRRRCLQAAHERYNWETESAKLLELYAGLGRRAAAA